jgi:hypothetical protein
MAPMTFLAFTSPAPGREEEFHTWYRDQHLHEVLSVPGILSARRWEYRTSLDGTGPEPEHTHLVIYEVDTDDVEATKAALVAAQSGWQSGTERGRGPGVQAWFFAPLGDLVVSPNALADARAGS